MGPLTKKGAVIKSWKHRYFVVNPDFSVSYYLTEEVSSNDQNSMHCGRRNIETAGKRTAGPRERVQRIFRFSHGENQAYGPCFILMNLDVYNVTGVWEKWQTKGCDTSGGL